MNANEPVAIRYDFDGYGYQYMDSGSGSDWQTRVAGELLYTHPVKELTDEEIMEICIKFGMYDCINDPYIKKDGTYSLDKDLIRFARAILRKVQE